MTSRANVNMHQTNSGKSPKFVFSPIFIFCSPICPNNCGVVFLREYMLVSEKWLFSFDRSNMKIFTLNITQVVWPHVTNLLDLRNFCRHNPLFYHLNLIPCHYWSWQRNIYFLVNIFVRHTFSMSKSSICNATSVFTITLPKIPSSEWFKWTLNFLVIFGEYFCPTYFFYVEK